MRCIAAEDLNVPERWNFNAGGLCDAINFIHELARAAYTCYARLPRLTTIQPLFRTDASVAQVFSAKAARPATA